jgi:hypothetical protein
MNLHESILLAQKVLEEERVSPTVRYMLREPVVGAFAPAALALAEKGRHPRTVCERPGIHRFTSENFKLLAGFYAELADSDKSRFVDVLASRITDGRAYRNASKDVVGTGSWNHCTSELPLIAEFLVRQKQVAALLAALPKAPIRPALTLLLLQLEELIALDFTLLSDSDYGTLREAVSALLPTVDALNQQGRISDTKESNTRYHLVRELPPLCHSIAEMCRKAVFLRLKTARGSARGVRCQLLRSLFHYLCRFVSSSPGGLASARESLCRCLGSRWFTERFHRNALVTHFQHVQVFCTARRLENYAVARCRLHQRAPQR